jgi:CDP-glucose 4,6-dehydratase
MVNASFWQDRRVLITGHTGFKGSWLSVWLSQMGARVTGFSLPADETSLFRQARIADLVEHIEGDIRDMDALESAVQASRAEVVFHLAAQPLVRKSYEEPVETYATNVQGTVHLLDCCRRLPSLRSIVCVTSDKCYENRDWVWPYRESDPMGGYDPYSSSKGAAELVISAYRRSYFNSGPYLASVRAGNVIGGGDWAESRLIPDIVRAMIAGEKPLIRYPNAVRPWQHVLEALGGYIMIAERLFAGDQDVACGWNFGPRDEDAKPVDWIANRLTAAWGAPGWRGEDGPKPHEARYLKLDCTKARSELGWNPVLSLDAALTLIVEWHKFVERGGGPLEICCKQLDLYRGQLTEKLLESQSHV